MSHTANLWNGSPATRPVTRLAGGAVPATTLAAVVAEMAQGLRSCQRPFVEELLDRYPDLAATTTAVLKLIHEEFCLRRQHGCPAEREDFFQRFPELRDQLEVLLGGDLTRVDSRVSEPGM